MAGCTATHMPCPSTCLLHPYVGGGKHEDGVVALVGGVGAVGSSTAGEKQCSGTGGSKATRKPCNVRGQ